MIPPHIELDDYLGQAFHRMPVAMIVVDQGGAITRINRLAESTFGYEPQELLGRPVEQLMPARYRGAHRGHRLGFLDEASARPMGLGRDLSGLRKDGSEFPVEIGLNPVQTDAGTMVLTVILDLTERKQAEQRTRDALMQKDLLLREVHHRVKNNLQVIHSLLDLQALQMGDHAVLSALRDSQSRIRSMSLIHQTLYQSHDLACVDFQRFLDALVPSLIEAYRAASGQVCVEIMAHQVKLPINEAIPCGLIVNELVSNALKHGFAEGRGGRIAVAVRPLAPDTIELSVDNDGHGLPQGFDPNRTDTLGMQLVRLLTRQLDGTLDIQSAGPTRFSLRFALKQPTR